MEWASSGICGLRGRNARRLAVLLVMVTGALVGSVPALAAGETAAQTAPMPEPVIHRHFIRATDGTRLNVLEAGRSSMTGAVIAFIPGWSMPASLFTPQLLALGRRYRVAALDPRGQGESEVPRAGYTLRQRADDIRRFVERYPRVVLVAWSLGALESLEYLRRYGSSRTAGLVIVDSSIGENPASPPASSIGSSPASSNAASPGDLNTAPSALSFSDELRLDRDKALTDFIRAIFRTPQPPAQLDALREVALRMPLEASLSLFPGRVPREHWRKIVHGFGEPLLYAVTPQFAAQAQVLLASRPGTRVEVFEQAGHALFVDEPERFNAALGEFMQSIQPRRPSSRIPAP